MNEILPLPSPTHLVLISGLGVGFVALSTPPFVLDSKITITSFF